MVISLSDLSKSYGKLQALSNLCLDIEKGEVFGLLGPNGSGKTTAINCILSLLNFDEGEIRLFGEKMSPSRYDLKKRIGVVPQHVAVFNEL
ncbi:MAG: ATP-binding cassette domain-containing protein, partial [Oscillospiraceae bacterium]|nr:ATP-binding cassette domain-containing protein [Oscillospiraceae bacterium]